MQHTGDGGSGADIVFKTWNGADTTGYTGDENGDYNRLTIHANGGIAAPTSAPPRSPRPAAPWSRLITISASSAARPPARRR